MGYDLHITRAEDWVENAGREIDEAEWLRVVEADPELELDGRNPGFVLWKGKSLHAEPWFQWEKGNIGTKNPDSALLGKMLEVAQRLGARVQGDDGEHYENASDINDEAVMAQVSGKVSLLNRLRAWWATM